MQRYLRFMLAISMLPALVSGLGADRVLCVGTGHLAIEPAAMCPQATCVSVACAAPVGEKQPLERAAFSSPSSCGPCADIPGASLNTSSRQASGIGAERFLHPALAWAMAALVSTTPACAAVLPPADTPVQSAGGSLTTVLLI